MPRGPRLLLDTNLWSYVGDAGAGPDLYARLGARGILVVLTPGMLTELARNPNVELSSKHVEAMLSGHRIQLASEAELLCSEIASEIARLRPDWLLPHPDAAATREYSRFWTKELWRFARRDWPFLVSHLRERGNDDEDAEANMAAQRLNKDAWLSSGVKLELNDLWIHINEDAPAWVRIVWPPSERVEAWRGQMWMTFRTELRDFLSAEAQCNPDAWKLAGRTWADWLRATVDIDRMILDHKGFADFWLREVDASRMTRTWLLWAVNTLQLKVKLGSGNAGDAQHAQHLVDADLFLTADARYANVLRSVAVLAPRAVAEIRRVPAGRDDIVDKILDAVDAAQVDRQESCK